EANHNASSDSTKSNDSGDSNSSKNTDQNNSQTGKHDGDDPNVSKALDAIGGLMDKVGFGDPPPNPYQELPFVKPDDFNNNLCDPKHEAIELSDSSKAVIGTSGIPMERNLLVVNAWGRKFGDSESIDTVSKITNKYVEVADGGTYFDNADAEKGRP